MASPLIVNIIQRLVVDDMENRLVNLINHIHYRDAIIFATQGTDLKRRWRTERSRSLSLNTSTAGDLAIHFQVWKTLRILDADIVHTRNLPTLEFHELLRSPGVRGAHSRRTWPRRVRP